MSGPLDSCQSFMENYISKWLMSNWAYGRHLKSCSQIWNLKMVHFVKKKLNTEVSIIEFEVAFRPLTPIFISRQVEADCGEMQPLLPQCYRTRQQRWLYIFNKTYCWYFQSVHYKICYWNKNSNFILSFLDSGFGRILYWKIFSETSSLEVLSKPTKWKQVTCLCLSNSSKQSPK